MWGIIVFFAIVLVISMIFSVLAKTAARPKLHTLEYEKENLLRLEYMKDESVEIENEHTVRTFDGKTLWVGFVPAKTESKRYVILSHGYTSNRYGVYKYAAIWRKMGFHSVLYENRGHGVNVATDCSFGWRESRDLMTVIEDTYERYGADIRIGLHGESMGAGLQLMALEYNPTVDFIINDCGYSEILPVLRWKVQDFFHFPGWLADMASPFGRLFHGYWYQKVRPIDRLKDNEIPICFVHGIDDNFTHKWHSEKMYEANKGYKELHLFEGADHAQCIAKDVVRYQNMLENFVSKVYKEDI